MGMKVGASDRSRKGEQSSLPEAVQRYHEAADHFAKGDPEPVKALFSRRPDVTLANPFGPAVRGWESVAAALDFASSRFSEREVSSFERLADYVSDGLASLVELEVWEARAGEREGLDRFELRVTSTFRVEDNAWKLVHRHADPVPTAHPDGPVRNHPAS